MPGKVHHRRRIAYQHRHSSCSAPTAAFSGVRNPLHRLGRRCRHRVRTQGPWSLRPNIYTPISAREPIARPPLPRPLWCSRDIPIFRSTTFITALPQICFGWASITASAARRCRNWSCSSAAATPPPRRHLAHLRHLRRHCRPNLQSAPRYAPPGVVVDKFGAAPRGLAGSALRDRFREPDRRGPGADRQNDCEPQAFELRRW